MLFTTLLIATLATVPGLASPTPTTSSAPSTVTPVFCNAAEYGPNDYPYGIPRGAGYCWVPSLKSGKCYDFTSFPKSETGPLIHNLTFTHIGNNFECNLYKIKHCHGNFFTAAPGDEDYGNKETADTSYNKAVDSFRCFLT